MTTWHDRVENVLFHFGFTAFPLLYLLYFNLINHIASHFAIKFRVRMPAFLKFIHHVSMWYYVSCLQDRDDLHRGSTFLPLTTNMLHCSNCSAPIFDIENDQETVLDTIPRDSLAVNLAAAVTRARQTIDKFGPRGQTTANDSSSGIDKALEKIEKAREELKELRRERLAATAAGNLRAKLPYIHLLSVEILSRIFCFSVEREEDAYASRAAIAVGGVCKKWRNVVERVARCWAFLPSINILEPTDDSTFLQLQQHVKKAQQIPLNAFFYFMESVEDGSDTDVEMSANSGEAVIAESKVAQSEILGVLLPILPRIRSLDLRTTDLEAHKIAKLGQVEFTALEGLSIHLKQGGEEMTTFSTIDTFLNAPNLKHLSLSRCMHTAEVTDDLSSFSFPWQQLTFFHCCYFSTDNLIPVLRAASNLQTVSFRIRPDSEPPKRSLQEVHDFVRRWEVVTHQCITDFDLDGFSFVKSEGGGETLVDDLLSRLTMPSLACLRIARTKDCNLRQFAPLWSDHTWRTP